MKKLTIRITISLFICLFSTIVQAKEVNKQTAEKIATNAFARLADNKNKLDFQIKEILTVKSEEKVAFYIVNFKPAGFIILSASDATNPILASSTDSNFTFDNLPPQLSYLLDSYKKQIKEIEDKNILPTDDIKQRWNKYSRDEISFSPIESLKSATSLPSQVAPLLSTTWNQDNDWNYFCPTVSGGPGGRCYAGCVGVAFAQVLYYWGCKVNESGTITDTRYNGLSVNLADSNYSWGNMSLSTPDSYNAKLIYDCAIAALTIFGKNSSGGDVYHAAASLSNNFGMKSSVVQESPLYSTYAASGAWANRLKEELSQGRPIVYSGFSVTPQDTVGHAWVIDGYDANDNFHCNWGWGNSSANDVYYNIDNLHPTTKSRTYNTDNWATLGIEPVMSTCDEINGGNGVCASGTSFNVPNLPQGATVTWDKSSNITIVSSQPTNPCTFQANGSGVGWIEATVNNNGQATLERKAVWVGSLPTPVISGNTTVKCGNELTYRLDNANAIGGETYLWDSNILLITQGESQAECKAMGGGYNGTGTIYCTVTACGLSKTGSLNIRVICESQLRVSPNPATSEVNVELVPADGEELAFDTTWDLEVYNSSTQSLKTKVTNIEDNKQTVNTSAWKEGVYVVRAKVGDKILTGKIVVKH